MDARLFFINSFITLSVAYIELEIEFSNLAL